MHSPVLYLTREELLTILSSGNTSFSSVYTDSTLIEMTDKRGQRFRLSLAAFDAVHPHLPRVVQHLVQRETSVHAKRISDIVGWLNDPLTLDSAHNATPFAVTNIRRLRADRKDAPFDEIYGTMLAIGTIATTLADGTTATIDFPNNFMHSMVTTTYSSLDDNCPGWRERLVAAESLGLEEEELARYALLGQGELTLSNVADMGSVTFDA